MIIYCALGDAFGSFTPIYVRTSNSDKPLQKVVLGYWNTDKEEIEAPLSRLRKNIIRRERLDKVNFTICLALGLIGFGILLHTIENHWFADLETIWQ